MTKKHIAAAATAAAILLLSFSSATLAQNQGALAEVEFGKFVTINVELHKLMEQYEPALNAANEDPGKRAALESELKSKTHEVLAKNEVTPERYREIYKIIDADPQLRTKAMLQIEEQRQKG
jgi:hypothetical protein